MALTLMIITNQPKIALACEKAGVDWIFVDLEILGKKERQGHLDTVQSMHTVDDVRAVKEVLTRSKLLVRINPLHDGSDVEIEAVLDAGADIVMLPYFTDAEEVREFIQLVNGRAEVCLLLETPEALKGCDNIFQVPGIDFVHIGLNDLHLGLKKKFMFELLTDGTVELLSEKLRVRGIPFGFGGIARLGAGELSADLIIPEHRRFGSSMTILSRSFVDFSLRDDLPALAREVFEEVSKVRRMEDQLERWTNIEFDANAIEVEKAVQRIVVQGA